MNLEKIHRDNRSDMRVRSGHFKAQSFPGAFGHDAVLLAYNFCGVMLEDPPNSNKGPLISAMRWTVKSKKNRDDKSAWCAYFASFILQWTADHRREKLVFEHSGGSVRMFHKNREKHANVIFPGDVELGNATLLPGDVIIRTRRPQDVDRAIEGTAVLGHTMLCAGFHEPTGMALTIEGNTNSTGDSEEGGGVWAKRYDFLHDGRAVAAIRPKVQL